MRKETSSRRFARRMLIVLLALPIAFIAGGCGKPSSRNPFPDKTKERIVLKPAKEGEDIRYTTYWPDGVTPMTVRVERKDGITVYLSLRHDGTTREVREFYAAKAGAGVDVSKASSPFEFSVEGRQLKAHSVFETDGVHLSSLDQFRKDGTKEVYGRRLADGTFQKLTFHPDGLTLMSTAVYANNGSLVSERTFTADGARVATFTRGMPGGKIETTSYRVDGSVEKVALVAENGEEEIDFYAADGKTRRMTVKNGVWYLEAIYYLPNGEPDHSRKWNRAGDNMSVVKFTPGSGKLGPFGKELAPYAREFEQEWSKVTPEGQTEARWQLSSVTEKDAQGRMKRKLIFHTKGYLFKTWNYTDGFNTHDELFREDGTLERVDHFEKGKVGIQRSENVAAEKGVQPKVDSKLLKQLPYEDPRPLVKQVPEPPRSPSEDYPIDD